MYRKILNVKARGYGGRGRTRQLVVAEAKIALGHPGSRRIII